MDREEFYISDLIMDRGTQARAVIHQPTVNQYAELYQENVELPPVHVVMVDESDDGDGAHPVLVDGFHRVAALRQLGRKTVFAIATDGAIEDAKWLALGANAVHGKRLSLEDVEHATELALEHPKAKEMTNAQIARHIGISERSLNRIKRRIGASRSYERAYDKGQDPETQAAIKTLEKQFPDEVAAIRRGDLVKTPEQLKEFALLPREHRQILAPMFLDKNLSVAASKDIASLRPTSESIAIGMYLRYAKENPQDTCWLFDNARCRVDILWLDEIS